jgi:cytokinin dehydrogenase
MRVYALDHIVLNVADVERSLAFYEGVLGLPAERVDLWRQGKVGFPSVRINDQTIIDLVAHAAKGDNLAHLCLVCEGTAESIVEDLKASGVQIESGPKWRSGARGDGSSVYIHDPDGNQVEIRCY